MDKLFSLVIETSIYGSISGIIILLTRLILKNTLLPNWRYWLWMLLIVKLIVPFGPKSNISIFNQIEGNGYVSKDYFINNEPYKVNDKVSDFNIFIDKEIESIKNQSVSISKFEKKQEIKGINISKYLLFSWIIGCLTIMIFSFMSYIKFIKYLYKLDFKNNKAVEVLNDCKKILNIRKDISLIPNSHIDTPALFGVRNIKILIPINLINLNEKELKYIFLHELAHYKRKDNIVNLMLLIIQSIHWFNPFIWYLFKQIREDMELATDEKVLKTLESNEYRDYGITLINVVSQIRKDTKVFTPNIVSMINNKKDMERRLMNIKLIKGTRHKALIYSLVGILSLSVLSPIVLTTANANDNIISNLNNQKKNKLQDFYFKLIDIENINKTLTRKEVKEIADSMKIKFESENVYEIGVNETYKLGDEELTVNYWIPDKKTMNEKSVYLHYTVKNEDSNLNLIELNYSGKKIDTEDKRYNINISTDSSKSYDQLIRDFNKDVYNNSLYPLFKDLNEILDTKGIITKNELLKLYPNLKTNEGVYYKMKNDKNEGVTICLDDKEGYVLDVAIWKKNEQGQYQHESPLYAYSKYNVVDDDIGGTISKNKYVGGLSVGVDSVSEQKEVLEKIINTEF